MCHHFNYCFTACEPHRIHSQVLLFGAPNNVYYTFFKWHRYLCFLREWSDEGIETIVLSETEVECITNHLSSFAVLVDHRGLLETEVKKL